MALPIEHKERIARNNAINITTDLTNSDNPAYLIDRRLLEVLLNKYDKGNLNDIKAELVSIINKHDDKDTMFQAIDNHIYCNNIAQAVYILDTKHIEDTFEAVAG